MTGETIAVGVSISGLLALVGSMRAAVGQWYWPQWAVLAILSFFASVLAMCWLHHQLVAAFVVLLASILGVGTTIQIKSAWPTLSGQLTSHARRLARDHMRCAPLICISAALFGSMCAALLVQYLEGS